MSTFLEKFKECFCDQRPSDLGCSELRGGFIFRVLSPSARKVILLQINTIDYQS